MEKNQLIEILEHISDSKSPAFTPTSFKKIFNVDRDIANYYISSIKDLKHNNIELFRTDDKFVFGTDTIRVLPNRHVIKLYLEDLKNPKKVKSKEKKDWFKIIGVTVGILSFIYSVFSTERIYTKDKEIDELEDKVMQQHKLHKAFQDSIDSIFLEIENASLNDTIHK